MKRLLAALAAVLVSAMPVKAAPPLDPFLTLDTPPPYHYGGTITVTAHGDIPKDRGDLTTNIQLFCSKGTDVVYVEVIGHVVAETPYTLHFGQSNLSQWDLEGGGAATCRLTFYREEHKPATPYTRLFIDVEA